MRNVRLWLILGLAGVCGFTSTVPAQTFSPRNLSGVWIGRWEGNTLVVDSIGFNDIPWLNFYGDPHSDAMHLTERYRRVDAKTLEIAVTINDPKAYTKPWVNEPKQYNLEPKWEIGEHYCVIDEENAYADAVRLPAGQTQQK